jgi:glycosyltransferase involved in cell wall biosynthesis
MKIAIFTDTFLPKIDGVAISIYQFCNILAEKGHEFTICAPKYKDDEKIEMELHPNIKIFRFKNAPLPSYPDVKIVLPSHKKIKKAVKEFGAELIHLQTPGLLGQYALLASKLYNVPMVGTYHTLISEQEMYLSLYRLLNIDKLMDYFILGKKIKKNLEKIENKATSNIKKALLWKYTNSFYENCEVIISPTEMIRKELIQKGVKKPIEVVSNGIDFQMFEGKPKEKPNDPPKIIHVGRISYEKNCDVILRAFHQLKKEIPGITLDIYGDGPALKSLKIEARHLDIYDSVIFHGFVDRSELPKIYPLYDIFITASTMETQGLVVLEAMACGLPCVGVNSFALPELIQNDVNGYTVEPGDFNTIAEKTMDILNDVEKFKKFSRNSIQIAKQHDIYESVKKLEAIYLQVIEDFYKKS